MFRRSWKGLPPDPIFPDDLEGLGYFINEVDEIRSIKNPKNYFYFFEYKNMRWNERQSFHMNTAMQRVVLERLEKQGLQKTVLPLGTKDLSQPHTKILTSVDLAEKSRVVLVFGETVQDLGILAYRVVDGRGGVDKGSMVSVVKAIKEVHKASDKSDVLEQPGIILANMGETWWWPEGKRALTSKARHEIPMASEVHWTRPLREELNRVPENRNQHEHVRYIFEKVVPAMIAADAKLDVIGVGDGADAVEKYLSETWPKWAGRLSSLANVGGNAPADELSSEGFKDFLKRRGRAWIANEFHHVGTVISGPDGNAHSSSFTGQGCPVHSAGRVQYTELMLISTHMDVLRWQAEVAATEGYENPFAAGAVHPDEMGAEMLAAAGSWPEARAAQEALEKEEAAQEAAREAAAAEKRRKARLEREELRKRAEEESRKKAEEELQKKAEQVEKAKLKEAQHEKSPEAAKSSVPETLQSGTSGKAGHGQVDDGEAIDPLANHQDLKLALMDVMGLMDRKVMQALGVKKP